MIAALLAGQILNGLAAGMLYALVGIGLALVLGVLNIPNFAHGALYAVGAYVASWIDGVTGSFYLAVLIAPFVVGLLGILLESQFIRRLYTAHHDYQLLFLFAVAMIIPEVIIIIWGPVGFSVLAPRALAGAINLGFTIYPLYRLVLIGVTVTIIAALWLFLTRTNVGAIVRAGIENREMVSILGIDIERVFMATFALGVWLAGLAGALATPILGLTPSMGGDILPISFVVVVIAGLGSILGALSAGLMIGLVQSLTAIWWPEAANVAIYVLMALTITLRPRGLFGTRDR